MSELEPQARRVMELWLEGRSHAEVAAIVGLPPRAIAAIRSASLRRLRERIAELPLPDENGSRCDAGTGHREALAE
jgi:DNA-directed RNA polymerase specialized sigma24 family protein